MGQIHVFPLGSWMTIQVLGLSRISFLKSYREAVRLEKFNFGVSLFWGRALGKSSTFVSIFVLRQFLVLIINHSFKVANAGCCLLAAAFLAAACLLACLPAACCLLLLLAAACLLACCFFSFFLTDCYFFSFHCFLRSLSRTPSQSDHCGRMIVCNAKQC